MSLTYFLCSLLTFYGFHLSFLFLLSFLVGLNILNNKTHIIHSIKDHLSFVKYLA